MILKAFSYRKYLPVTCTVISALFLFGGFHFPENDSQDKLTEAATDFVSRLEEGKFDEAASLFDATMNRVMPSDKLRQTWNSVLQQVGSFQKQVAARTEILGLYTIIFITTKFESAELDIKIVFNQEGRIAGLFFQPASADRQVITPPYIDQKKFVEEDVLVGSGEWAVPGTLSRPASGAKPPALILVHGSGPTDRDESIGPNKPFKNLAHGLAGKGIAVLRYEKRTLFHNKKFLSSEGRFTIHEETIEDALLAADLLRKKSDIDAKNIFILGHSLGGMMIPRIGQQDSSIAGFIIMAGAVRPLEDSILDQMTYISNLDGNLSSQENKQLEDYRKAVDRIKSLKPEDIDSPARRPILGAFPEYWLDLRGYHPPSEALKLKAAMLIIQGERDYQVTPSDFMVWKDFLKDRKNVTFKLYPRLNHLFIAGEGKIAPAEYQKPGYVAAEVIADIADWIFHVSHGK